jgi:hypothetical protein
MGVVKSPAPRSLGRLPIRGMLYPMANMDVQANSVKHLECRFAAKVQQLEAP